MNLKVLIVVFGIVLMGQCIAWAFGCPPCTKVLELKESMHMADFILLVEKTRDGPRNDNGYGWGGPDWIEVKVKGSIKGRWLPPKIKVNSYEGRCQLGAHLKKGREYVLLLTELEASNKAYRFDVVNRGCGVKQLKVEDDYIIVDGERWTVEELEALLY